MKNTENNRTILNGIDPNIKENASAEARKLISENSMLITKTLIRELARKLQVIVSEPAARHVYPNVTSNDVIFKCEEDGKAFALRAIINGHKVLPLYTTTTVPIKIQAYALLEYLDGILSGKVKMPGGIEACLQQDPDTLLEKLAFVIYDKENIPEETSDHVEQAATAKSCLNDVKLVLAYGNGNEYSPVMMDVLEKEGIYPENLLEDTFQQIEDNFEPFLCALETADFVNDENLYEKGIPDDTKVYTFINKAAAFSTASLLLHPGELGHSIRKHFEDLFGGKFYFAAPLQMNTVVFGENLTFSDGEMNLKEISTFCHNTFDEKDFPLAGSPDLFVCENGNVRRV